MNKTLLETTLETMDVVVTSRDQLRTTLENVAKKKDDPQWKEYANLAEVVLTRARPALKRMDGVAALAKFLRERLT